MPTYIGYNTQGQDRKFTLSNHELIKRDLLNAFNIKPGELVGRPGFGCGIWNLMFENQTADIITGVKKQIEKTVSADPRIAIQNIAVYPQENGVLVELEILTDTGTPVDTMQVMFDNNSRTASTL